MFRPPAEGQSKVQHRLGQQQAPPDAERRADDRRVQVSSTSWMIKSGVEGQGRWWSQLPENFHLKAQGWFHIIRFAEGSRPQCRWAADCISWGGESHNQTQTFHSRNLPMAGNLVSTANSDESWYCNYVVSIYPTMVRANLALFHSNTDCLANTTVASVLDWK